MKKIEKLIKKDLRAIETPPSEKVIPAYIAQTPTASSVKERPKKKMPVTAAVCVALIACLAFGTAAAAAVTIINSNRNAEFLEEGYKQLTEVPEGFTGIYTLEDLLAYTEADLDECNEGKYILMADINIPDEAYLEGGILEGGFKPMQSPNLDTGEYIGPVRDYIFNGNGHVIRNLKINAYVSDESNFRGVGLFSWFMGNIRYLGIEDSEIRAVVDNTIADVGVIAGYAGSITACYTKNVKVTVENRWNGSDSQFGSLYENTENNVGGLVGRTYYLDSCYSIADITVSGRAKVKENVGGIVGNTLSAITCFSGSSIDVSGLETECEVDHVARFDFNAPKYMTKDFYVTMLAKLREKYPPNGEVPADRIDLKNDAFEVKHFAAYYAPKDPNLAGSEEDRDKIITALEIASEYYGFLLDDKNYLTDGESACYLPDPCASPFEWDAISKFIAEAFDGNKYAYADLCNNYGIKAGTRGCYMIEEGKTYKAKDFEEFKFGKIWVMKDGLPALVAFEAE